MQAPVSTIAAIATPPGLGAVAILRLSGPDAHAIAARLLEERSRRRLESAAARFHAAFLDPESGERLDEGLVHVFHAPRSFTGEDVVELQGHGGRVAPERLLEAALRAGAVIAGPGEFTRRALLNGKLDLLQAEAILDLVQARSEAAQRQAVYQLAGGLSRRIEALRGALIEVMSGLELQIDFPEEEIEIPSDWSGKVERVRKEVDALLATYEAGGIARSGIQVVIAGLPNVGKSSLFNMLLGEERAIVTSVPGTTRDAIEAEITIGGIMFRLVDTAGLRQGGDEIESLGIDLSRRHLEAAQIVLLVLDATRKMNDEEVALKDALEHRLHVTALSKVDLMPGWSSSNAGAPHGRANKEADNQVEIAGSFEINTIYRGREGGFAPVPTSARTGTGRKELLDALLTAGLGGRSLSCEEPTLTRLRHRVSLEACRSSLTACLHVLYNEAGSPEKAAADLRDASEHLAQLIGRVTSEDLLDAIFSEYCIGK
jgi:tRNA modification GTPase